MKWDKHRIRQYDKARQTRGRTYIDQTKMSIGGCQHCGLRCDLEKLDKFDFDHIDPKTKFRSISRMAMYPIHVIKREIEKCQLLCRPCHIKRTTEKGHNRIRGGIYTAPNNTDQLTLDL